VASIVGSIAVILVSAAKVAFDLRAGRRFPAAMAALCGSIWLVGLVIFLASARGAKLNAG